MNVAIREMLEKELALRGFRADGASPNSTLILNREYLDAIELSELFETMVARREKLFRSADVVGKEASERSYDDTVLVIEALKAVMQHFLPR